MEEEDEEVQPGLHESYAPLTGAGVDEPDFDNNFKQRYSVWQHFLERGHNGKVWCINSSDNTDYIVSGGADYTMRVWAYDETTDVRQSVSKSSAYDLCAILLHDNEYEDDIAATQDRASKGGKEYIKSMLQKAQWQRGISAGDEETPDTMRGVTAVNCVGHKGPFISGTGRGDIFVLWLGFGESQGKCLPQIGLHNMKINEIAVPDGYGDLTDDDSWVMAVASDDGCASLFECKGEEFDVSLLRHEGKPVIGVRHIEGGGTDRAAFVTHTDTTFFVWNLQGVQLCNVEASWDDTNNNNPRLSTHSSFSYAAVGNVITDISAANKDNGALLFVSNAHAVQVWGLKDGEFCGPHGECPPPEPYDKKPLVVYGDMGKCVEVDQSRHSTEFFVDIRDDYTCGVYRLHGADYRNLVMEPQGPASLLVTPKKKHMLLDLKHSSKIMQLKVVEDTDDAGGPGALVCCANGSIQLWDLEGVDKGEIYAELRSLARWEVFLPIFLLLTSFLQATSFAFGPQITWRDEVRVPANYTRHIVCGEFDMLISIPRDQIFIPLVWTVLGSMMLFLVVVLTAWPEVISHLVYLTQSTPRYRHEKGKRGFRRMHTLKSLLELVRRIIDLFLWLCATIWVVPMFKVLAQAVDCVHELDEEHKKPFLATAPEIACFEGRHLTIVFFVFFIGPLYALLLVPFVGVEGDASYMKWNKLFRPFRYWAQSSHRRATVCDLGPLHPNPDTIFTTLTIDAAAKVLLPIIETELTSHPYIQQSLVCAVGFVLFISSMLVPPKAELKFCRVVQGLRLFTLCAMLCGFVTLLMEKGSVIPLAVLGLSFLTVIALTVLRVRAIPLQPPEVQRCSTSSLPKTRSASFKRAKKSDQGAGSRTARAVKALKKLKSTLF